MPRLICVHWEQNHGAAQMMRKPFFAYAKTKTQISFAVTAKLISAFVFATRKVQSLYFLNPKFQASSRLLWLCSPVCVGPGRKPRRPVFSQRGSYSPSRLSTVGHPYNIDLKCYGLALSFKGYNVGWFLW